MAKKDERKRDSIFDTTNGKGSAAKKGPKKDESGERENAPATPGAAKTAQGAGAGTLPPKPASGGGGNGVVVDRFQVLKSLLKTHQAEFIYRKSKEDRLFVAGLAVIVVTAIGAFLIRAHCAGCSGWFYSLVFRTFFAAMAGLAGFTASAMVELNRTRLQDLLAMIVKIQESFDLFKDGAYGEDGGAYLPNTYKFVGSINDDETNYAVLVLKLAGVIAAIAVFLLV